VFEKNRVENVKKLKETLCYYTRVLSYAIIFGSLSLSALTLYKIITQGYFLAVEPRLHLLILELLAVTYGFIFTFSLLLKEVKP